MNGSARPAYKHYLLYLPPFDLTDRLETRQQTLVLLQQRLLRKLLYCFNSGCSEADGIFLDTVKEKLDNYQHDYNACNYFFLPAVMTTSRRISGNFLRLLDILSHRQAANYFRRMGILDPPTQAYKQRRSTYFYYNCPAIGLACAQATAMRIDIAPHKRPRKSPPTTSPTTITSTSPTSMIRFLHGFFFKKRDIEANRFLKMGKRALADILGRTKIQLVPS
jgi:hypothetical protein